MPVDAKHTAVTNTLTETGPSWVQHAAKQYASTDLATVEAVPGFHMRTTAWAQSLGREGLELPSAASINYALPESVCAEDDRVQIRDTTAFPNKCITKLYITGESGRWVGTGFFISPRCIITNGHCVFPDRKWAKEIRVVPGQNRDVAPFGSAVSSRFWSVEGWIQPGARGEADYDYGAVILEDETLFNRIRAHFGFANVDDPGILNNCGYPADKPVGTQWFNAGPVSRKTARRFFYMIDTAGGQSGSPVWINEGGDRLVVGVHGYGGCPNSAIRCTSDVTLNWANWSQA